MALSIGNTWYLHCTTAEEKLTAPILASAVTEVSPIFWPTKQQQQQKNQELFNVPEAISCSTQIYVPSPSAKGTISIKLVCNSQLPQAASGGELEEQWIFMVIVSSGQVSPQVTHTALLIQPIQSCQPDCKWVAHNSLPGCTKEADPWRWDNLSQLRVSPTKKGHTPHCINRQDPSL